MRQAIQQRRGQVLITSEALRPIGERYVHRHDQRRGFLTLAEKSKHLLRRYSLQRRIANLKKYYDVGSRAAGDRVFDADLADRVAVQKIEMDEQQW